MNIRSTKIPSAMSTGIGMVGMASTPLLSSIRRALLARQGSELDQVTGAHAGHARGSLPDWRERQVWHAVLAHDR